MMVMTSNSYRWSPGSISGEVKFIFLLPWNLRVETMGEGDHESADSCKIVEVEGVGAVELVCVGRLLRMGCDSFVMLVCGSVRSGEPGSRMGHHRNILLRTNGGGGEAGTESLILWLVVLESLAGGWWWSEAQSLIQGLLETHILYTWLWERQPWGWVRLSDWVKETLIKAEWKFIFIWFYDLFIFYSLLIIFYVSNFFRISKWLWLPWISAVGLVRESPRVPIAEAPATFRGRWGRVGRMMTREWSVSPRVCGVWVGETDVESHEG